MCVCVYIHTLCVCMYCMINHLLMIIISCSLQPAEGNLHIMSALHARSIGRR